MAAEEERVSWWMDGTVESMETEWSLSFNRIDPEQAWRLKGKRRGRRDFERQGEERLEFREQGMLCVLRRSVVSDSLQPPGL